MESPSVGQLENLVRSIILDRLHDGQLDESGLTITDLKALEETLVHGLTAVFHNRISYPGQEEAQKRMEEEKPDAVAAAAATEETEGDATATE
jgi:membrane-associated HD superfamily phosphohydrolase